MENLIINLSQISKESIELAGGKGASLGEMMRVGINVPRGFVVGARVYEYFLEKGDITEEIKTQIIDCFNALNVERVIVRSSALSEDSADASWAGQLESYLDIQRNDLIESIKRCWQSMRTIQANEYVNHKGLGGKKLLMAVVVQEMVKSEASGVVFSVNPINKNREELMIEACLGMGELLVQGIITPENYIVDKHDMNLLRFTPRFQKSALFFRDGKIVEIKLKKEISGDPILDDRKLKKLSAMAVKIENHYGFPQDIEWALEKETFYIVQSRPITTL